MKTIIGYTDSVDTCDCCGRTDLKGTYCIDLDGVELYYGSVCAFKAHGVTEEEKEVAMNEFKAKKLRVKAEDKLIAMEAAHNGSEYSLVKMLRFVEAKNLDIMAFINKYGKKFDETDFYIGYSIGHVVKTFAK